MKFGISPNLKIAESTEIEILKQETIEDIFEEKYENQDKEFLNIIDIYTSYRGDEYLKNIILDIYNYIQSTPFPKEWLEEKVKMFDIEETSFEKTVWGKILLDKVKDELQDGILRIDNELKKLKYEADTEKFVVALSEDIRKITNVYEKNTWDEVYIGINDLALDRFPVDKRVPDEIKDRIKQVRNKVKEDIKKITQNVMLYNSEEANNDVKSMYNILDIIKDLVLEFWENFSKAKQDRNIMDFNDIEHFALNILTAKEENSIANKYKEKYEEIMIDEYQDSNLVQEYILNTISRNNNIFMVGDVKQSIYKFRQARPELFLEKYETYKEKNALEEKDNLKIQLFKNFRSRDNVLKLTNIVFDNIMCKELGDIEYNEKEYLNLGAEYPEGERLEAELNIIDLKDDEESIYKEENTKEDEEEPERVEDILLEAKFVARKIKDLIDTGYMVCNKDKTYRKITYKDIVVLLRSTQTLAPIYEQEISKLNLPVYCDTSTGYLDSVEIQVIMSLLKIIDNPINDIALLTVLRSMIGGFSDNELIQIRIENKNKTFYEALCEYRNLEEADETLKNKINNFLGKIEDFRKCKEYMPLDEFIWKIYLDTGYYNYVNLMPNGLLRVANLKMLFEKAKQYEKTSFKGLYNFISFIDKLKLSNKDMSSAKIIGENEDVIRIMSIHKSKGLEFPVVFLCGTGKKFNVQDLNSNLILLHQDIGIGPKYINYKEGITYNTLAREAIKYKSKNEMLSEEMRILYVALTRAKEKLIITGIEKDYKKSRDKKEELLNTYKEIEQGNKINKNIIQKYLSYLDWIELVYLNSKDRLEKIFNVNAYKKEGLLKSMLKDKGKEEINIQEELKKSNIEIESNVKEKLEWEYKEKLTNNILTKSSVTKIKNMKLDLQEEERHEYNTPEFLKEEKSLTASEKGTLMHLVLQRLDENVNYDIQEIEKFICELEKKNIISEKEKNGIDINKIYEFTKSNIWKEMKNAKEIGRERPFYINIPAKEVYNEDIDEEILVQGIIDLYYITNDEKIILVDYKTDRVKSEEELIEKYKVQLNIYKRAIEKSLNKKVDKVYIYSVYLGKEIEVEYVF